MRSPSEHAAIPDGWQQVRLGEVARLGSGKAPPYDNENGTVPVLGSNGPIGLARVSNFSNGIAIGRVGASGSVRCVREAVWLSDNVLFVEPSAEAWNLSYLYNALKKANLPELASKTAQPLLTQNQLGAVDILLPPLREQRAIAAVLDSVDDAIEGAEEVIAATEQLRDALLHDLLTRGIPGQHTEWRDVPGLGTIPADWEVVRLGDAYEVQLGKMLSPQAKRGTNPKPYLTNRNVRWGEFDLLDLPTMDFDQREIEKFRLHSGDLMVCEGGETGRAAVWVGEVAECYYQKALHRLRPKNEDAITKFMLAILILYGKNGVLLEHSEQTSISHLTRERLLRMPIPSPTRDEQMTIAATLAEVDNAIAVAREEATGLRLLRESTADALLTGRLRVEQS